MIGTKTEHEAKSKALALMGLLLAALMAVSFLLIATPAYADDIFVVNRTGDASDKKINGSCDTSPKKRGQQCTLTAGCTVADPRARSMHASYREVSGASASVCP